MAIPLINNRFTAQNAAPTTQYAYAPQPPPSPPMDESSKCSLPSISNLLGLADQGSPTSEAFAQNQAHQASQQQQPQYGAKGEGSRPNTRPSSSHFGNPALMRGTFPPTPPMSTDASFDGYNSPSTRSLSQMSIVSQPQAQPQHHHQHNYYYESTPPLETTEGHRPMSQHLSRPHHQPTTYPATSGFPTSAAAAASSYLPPQPAIPPPPAAAAFYPPMQSGPPPTTTPQPPQVSNLFFQRPLPQVFPPPPPPGSLLAAAAAAAHNPWQHHHYISPSAAASFPQSQDRYICPTCNKAFSRPSSLRIHSHSHTGEKPFKCPHAGCGKAFSVRSNMKRHERGCHNFESGSTSSISS